MSATAWLSDDILNFMRDRVRESGGDPASIQQEPSSFLRIRDVVRRVGVSRAQVYRMIARNQFPKPVRVTG
ncbi:MAG TPA: AlpA family phage regulatory protein [Steroidobacteraceae bacterium]|nr:AlpA family phage regulatory protein [Steroidobacteraceae bacterium]